MTGVVVSFQTDRLSNHAKELPLSSHDRELLLDVSRLIWRLRGGRLPTGIDRVCLEYVAYFRARAQAVIQFKGRIWVLSPSRSDDLFEMLLAEPARFRQRLPAFMLRAIGSARRSAPRPGMLYLNVGHTGLHDRALPEWLAANQCRAVYLIHDLIPVTHPQFCRPGESAKHEARIRNALTSASGIIGNSRATLDELGRFSASRELPMPPATAAWISGYRSPRGAQPNSFDKPYFLTLGTIEGRKNHALLLRVWKRLAKRLGGGAPRLVIVGQRGWEADEAIAALDKLADLGDLVQELSRCRDEELHALIASANALLMPSFAEGFGLPVIEALQAGTPVIASDLPVFREVVGDIPTYLSPHDDAGWEDAVRSFTQNGAERLRQMEAMKDFRAPDWRKHFETVERWLPTLA